MEMEILICILLALACIYMAIAVIEEIDGMSYLMNKRRKLRDENEILKIRLEKCQKNYNNFKNWYFDNFEDDAK